MPWTSVGNTAMNVNVLKLFPKKYHKISMCFTWFMNCFLKIAKQQSVHLLVFELFPHNSVAVVCAPHVIQTVSSQKAWHYISVPNGCLTVYSKYRSNNLCSPNEHIGSDSASPDVQTVLSETSGSYCCFAFFCFLQKKAGIKYAFLGIIHKTSWVAPLVGNPPQAP